MRYCGACPACKEALFDFCGHVCEADGFTLNGGCAEFVLVKERQCWSTIAGLVDTFPGRGCTTSARNRADEHRLRTHCSRGGRTRAGCDGRGVRVRAGWPGVSRLLPACGVRQVVAFDTLPDRRALAIAMRCRRRARSNRKRHEPPAGSSRFSTAPTAPAPSSSSRPRVRATLCSPRSRSR